MTTEATDVAADTNDPAALKPFFDELPDAIDHVLVTVGGPSHVPPARCC